MASKIVCPPTESGVTPECTKTETFVAFCGARMETQFAEHYDQFAPIVAARSAELAGWSVSKKAAMFDCPRLFAVFRASNLRDLLSAGRDPAASLPADPKCDEGALAIAAGGPEVMHAFAQLFVHSPMGRRMQIAPGEDQFGPRQEAEIVSAVVSHLLGGDRVMMNDLTNMGELKTLLKFGGFRAGPDEIALLRDGMVYVPAAAQTASSRNELGDASELWEGFSLWMIDFVQFYRQMSIFTDPTHLRGFLQDGITSTCDDDVFITQVTRVVEARSADGAVFAPIYRKLITAGLNNEYLPENDIDARRAGGIATRNLVRQAIIKGLAKLASAVETNTVTGVTNECVKRGLIALHQVQAFSGALADECSKENLQGIKDTLADGDLTHLAAWTDRFLGCAAFTL